MSTVAPDDPNDVAVNLTGLDDFAKRLRVEAAHVRQEMTAMVEAYKRGVTVGAGMPTMGMAKVANHYRDALKRIIDQLDQFSLAGDVLADAAETIGQRYRTADELADVSLDDVRSALSAAAGARADPLAVQDRPDQRFRIHEEWAS